MNIIDDILIATIQYIVSEFCIYGIADQEINVVSCRGLLGTFICNGISITPIYQPDIIHATKLKRPGKCYDYFIGEAIYTTISCCSTNNHSCRAANNKVSSISSHRATLHFFPENQFQFLRRTFYFGQAIHWSRDQRVNGKL